MKMKNAHVYGFISSPIVDSNIPIPIKKACIARGIHIFCFGVKEKRFGERYYTIFGSIRLSMFILFLLSSTKDPSTYSSLCTVNQGSILDD